MRAVVNAPWNVTNQTTDEELAVPTAADKVQRCATEDHPQRSGYTTHVTQKLAGARPRRRLKKPFDLT